MIVLFVAAACFWYGAADNRRVIPGVGAESLGLGGPSLTEARPGLATRAVVNHLPLSVTPTRAARATSGADPMTSAPVTLREGTPAQTHSRDAAALAAGSLISTASTTYGDTIPNRRFNVELAASRLNGTVVAPGDVFSMNQALGEVSYRSGYKQAYGITESADGVETIPSDGGGICQVATTLFHAVFWAGYPVVERNWHLYWIPRYGLPPKGLKGLDATIDQVYGKNGSLLYSIDFRFKNNTRQPLLILAHTNGQQITISLYGIKPPWQVRVSGPTITNVVKTNSSPVSEPTSTLVPGQKLKVEEAEDGFTATIVRQIVQDGKVIDTQTFRSVYQPSRNVWLLGGSRASRAVSGIVAPADRPANVPRTSPGARDRR